MRRTGILCGKERQKVPHSRQGLRGIPIVIQIDALYGYCMYSMSVHNQL